MRLFILALVWVDTCELVLYFGICEARNSQTFQPKEGDLGRLIGSDKGRDREKYFGSEGNMVLCSHFKLTIKNKENKVSLIKSKDAATIQFLELAGFDL